MARVNWSILLSFLVPALSRDLGYSIRRADRRPNGPSGRARAPRVPSILPSCGTPCEAPAHCGRNLSQVPFHASQCGLTATVQERARSRPAATGCREALGNAGSHGDGVERSANPHDNAGGLSGPSQSPLVTSLRDSARRERRNRPLRGRLDQRSTKGVRLLAAEAGLLGARYAV